MKKLLLIISLFAILISSSFAEIKDLDYLEMEKNNNLSIEFHIPKWLKVQEHFMNVNKVEDVLEINAVPSQVSEFYNILWN